MMGLIVRLRELYEDDRPTFIVGVGLSLLVCTAIFTSLALVLRPFGFSYWWCLVATPPVFVGFLYVVTWLFIKFALKYRSHTPWERLNQHISPITRMAFLPEYPLDWDTLNSMLEEGVDINDADQAGRTLLDHMLSLERRDDFDIEDVEYVIELGARWTKDTIDQLRNLELDDAYMLARRLEAELRLPELQAIADQSVEREEGQRRRM